MKIRHLLPILALPCLLSVCALFYFNQSNSPKTLSSSSTPSISSNVLTTTPTLIPQTTPQTPILYPTQPEHSSILQLQFSPNGPTLTRSHSIKTDIFRPIPPSAGATGLYLRIESPTGTLIESILADPFHFRTSLPTGDGHIICKTTPNPNAILPLKLPPLPPQTKIQIYLISSPLTLPVSPQQLTLLSTLSPSL